MSSNRKYSPEESAIIVQHLEKMRTAAYSGLEKWKHVKTPGGETMATNMVAYHKHCVAAFNWAIQVCRQMTQG